MHLGVSKITYKSADGSVEVVATKTQAGQEGAIQIDVPGSTHTQLFTRALDAAVFLADLSEPGLQKNSSVRIGIIRSFCQDMRSLLY